MWNKILVGYIRRIYKVLLWLAFLTGCFALVLYLYHVPPEAAAYAALLGAVGGSVLVVIDFIQYANHCQKIARLLKLNEMEEIYLNPLDSLEEAYQTLAVKWYRECKELENRSICERQDLMDYYTLWVHQIKTPIAAMNLLLQTQESEQADAMAMELFKIEQYTEMVLQYLRIGSQSNDFVLQPYDLDDMIRQALRKYARLFIGRKLPIAFEETHLQVLTDEKWLVFVIEQLLSNALKYTNEGKISIYASGRNGFVIEDTGMGISPEDLPRIFEKGYTGFNGRMDKKATGLGLYLCKQICDKLSHEIFVESTKGACTRVTVITQRTTPQEIK